MVRNIPRLNRYAFTMIELIFAIVIIAISVMSLPMMTQVTSAGIERNFAQEAIFTSIAEMNIAITYTWDEVSLIDSNATGSIDELSRVININAVSDCADSGLDDSSGADIMRRTGHVHRRCLNTLATEPFTGVDSACVDSLNAVAHDFNSTYEGGAMTSAEGFKTEYESKLEVTKCNGACVDFGAAGNVNMKEIKVTLRDASDNEVITILRTYSANIGEVAYHRSTL